jgi:23S rRNA (adenine2503-C2)-methyltransferase
MTFMTLQKLPLDIKELSLAELQAYFTERHQPIFHAKQIFEWIYQKLAHNFDDMTNLSAGLRAQLKKDFVFSWLEVEKKNVSKDKTIKFLFKVGDGEHIETVYIPTKKRGTICLSTQVGCKFGCRFCASGLNGFFRDLSCAEILGQVLFVNKAIRPEEITHIVFMGVGEPFDNYDNVLKAIYRLNAKEAFRIGARRITVSTCGLIPEIKRFAEEPIQAELSVSLHAANDKLRSTLMPINKKYSLKDLMDCCRWYTKETNRQITFEYVLMQGINDRLEDARDLAVFLKGFLVKVNLIVYNRNDNLDFRVPSHENVMAFEQELVHRGIPATVRSARGDDIDAACGQLRFRQL